MIESRDENDLNSKWRRTGNLKLAEKKWLEMNCIQREVIFFMSQTSHESSYELVSGFFPKVRIRVRFRVRIIVGVGFRVIIEFGLDCK